MNTKECVLHGQDNNFTVVDHEAQASVCSGTKQECFDYMKPYCTRDDLHGIFGLDTIDLGGELSDMDLDFLAGQ